ncbi:hypothetical protein JCM33374_g3352 [Metschnikowia sp. JCM 33374]|nr:hypothetical protein JCM33374_g3352 [Metschnikowia sp. JCM 33374]
MRFSKWSVLALSVLSKANEQYPPLELKLSISRHPPASFTHLSKRDVAQDDIELGLLASHTFYRAKVRFGSEQEPVDLLVDTGSCSTWVMTKDVECFHSQQLMVDARLSRRQEGAGPIIEDAPVGVLERIPETGAQQQPQKIALPKTPVAELKHIDGQKCKRFGSFDSSKSTTFKKIATNAEFDIKFSDNTFSKGFWGHDTLYFGGIEVPHTQFGVVQKTDNIIGILGLGSDKSKRLPAEKIKYPDDFQTFPFVLQKHGLVKRAVFSLYLDEPNQRSGSVLFGAVDHAKYHGTLHTVPFANYYSQFSPEPLFYDVQLDSIEVEEPGKTATRIPADLVALLDSGSTLCSFNEAILTPLARSLGGVWRESVRLYEVDASAIQERHVSFWISSIKITIPAPRLLVRIKGVSYLGVSLEARQRLILGEEFLRHAYVVFDPERNEVSMAQAKYTALKDVEIVTGDIPRAIRADATAESTENRGTGVLASGNAKAPAAVPKKVRFKEEPEVIGVYDNAKSGEVPDPEGGGENRLGETLRVV